MQQDPLFIPDPASRTEAMSKESLAQENAVLRFEIENLVRELYRLRKQPLSQEQLTLILNEQLSSLRSEMFGVSSERLKVPKPEYEQKEAPAPRVKKPSERYPNTPVRAVVISFETPPSCEACGSEMTDSGMTEESQQLTVIPKRFEIINYIRPKYRCSCQGCIKTAPLPPRILEGSSYSDDMILDVALSKYCDLIPIERYSAMASREGLKDLPPHSLIELTHGLSKFIKPVYDLIKQNIIHTRVLHADETPHRMLEGSEKKGWYLWGLSTPEHCLFECHDTRSGDVAGEILKASRCEVLLTDVFSGYGKAIKQVNALRLQEKRVLIKNANCNAHARRYFFKCLDHYPETQFYLDHYQEIYQLNAHSKGKSPDEILELRSQMRPRFEEMQTRAREELSAYPAKNKYYKALNYFLENYEGLTLFLKDPEVDIDNNSQERLLRSHVVGRKTWYGTHSKQGAETAAILFTLVESCKLVGVNPREYFKALVQDLHRGQNPYTPHDYKTQNPT